MIDLTAMFVIEVNPLELFIRGTVIWWFIFLVLRFVMRRDMGEVGAADILLLVLVADAAQNGMAGEYKTITDGLVLVTTLFFWNWVLDFLSMHFDWVAKLTEPPPILLVKNGRYRHAAMRKLKLDVSDIQAEIRKNNIENVHGVKKVWFEGDGAITIIPKRQ